MSKVMPFDELVRTGDQLTAARAVVFYTFECPRCGQDVTIEQPNLLPETALHDIDSCGATVNVREAGGWWTAVHVSKPSDPGTIH